MKKRPLKVVFLMRSISFFRNGGYSCAAEIHDGCFHLFLREAEIRTMNRRRYKMETTRDAT